MRAVASKFCKGVPHSFSKKSFESPFLSLLRVRALYRFFFKILIFVFNFIQSGPKVSSPVSKMHNTYVQNFSITEFTKIIPPPCWMHSSQRSDTVLQIDWRSSALASKWWTDCCQVAFGPLCMIVLLFKASRHIWRKLTAHRLTTTGLEDVRSSSVRVWNSV